MQLTLHHHSSDFEGPGPLCAKPTLGIKTGDFFFALTGSVTLLFYPTFINASDPGRGLLGGFMSTKLSLEVLKVAVAGSAAAFRTVIEMQPAGGEGDKIFPATYEGGKYAEESRVLPEENEPVNCVLIDSVASQANRMELAMLEAWEERRLHIPMLTVQFPELPKPLRVTSLEAPHRISDALLRDSLYDGVSFRKSEVGQILDIVSNANATPLLRYCPTALLFGLWDSTGPRGGLGVKFQRILVSEIVGTHAVKGVKVASRLDPAQIEKGAAVIYESAKDGWSLQGKKTIGKEGKPSEINHGNVTPTIADGGFTVKKVLQTTVLSLPGLRRLKFPVANEYSLERNRAGRVLLAALGVAAVALSVEKGCDLRSRCFLIPDRQPEWELLRVPGEQPERFELTAESALQLVADAYREAEAVGLSWESDEILLEPREELTELVRRSQLLAMNSTEV
ncbi:MAG: type I-U CRISPR-associated RAMP protein Csb1/Cas7u [Vulcanimicrobiota bacterium]